MTAQSDSDNALWKHYVETYDAFLAAGMTFNAEVKDKVSVLKSAFRNGESRLALEIAQLLNEDDKKALFSELLGAASYSHGRARFAQEIILSLPHKWLLSNIEKYSVPLLVSADYETYRGLLTLYFKIDASITRKLAEQALSSEDEDIKDAGLDFITKLEG